VRGDFRSTPDFGRSRTASTTSIQCHWHRRMYVGSTPKTDQTAAPGARRSGALRWDDQPKYPLENHGRFPCPTFFQAIDISVLLPPSPGHQYNWEKYAITSVAYGHMVVTAGFRPWSYNSRPRIKSALPHNPASDRCAPTSAVAAPVA